MVGTNLHFEMSIKSTLNVFFLCGNVQIECCRQISLCEHSKTSLFSISLNGGRIFIEPIIVRVGEHKRDVYVGK